MRVAFARSPPRLRRIAFLGPYAEPLLWIEPLEERGWVEGRNLVVERRVTNGIEGLAGAARAIAAAEFDVIVTDGTDAARAANEATARIPIVMAAVGDPVGAGLVESLARPGGNLTGYSIQATETTVKRAQLVRELLPSAQKVMVVMDASNGKVLASFPIGAGVDYAAFDPSSKLAFFSCGDGTLNIFREKSASEFEDAGAVKTQPSAKTLAFDPKTRNIFLPAAEYLETPASSPGGRPTRTVKPGSFTLLVVSR